MSGRVDWNGTDQQMMQRMAQYGASIKQVLKQIAQFWAARLESYAKQHAPWTDRTANARQSLHTWIEELSRDTVRLYLSHGMDYGIQLETRFAGRYAIIWPTLEAHLPAISRMLQGVFG